MFHYLIQTCVDIYHVTFAVAPTDVSSRVVPVEGGQDYVLHRLEEYRRYVRVCTLYLGNVSVIREIDSGRI